MPSWKKVIVSGSSAHVLNITASNLPNLYKNHVLMYNTASGVITYFTSSLEPPPNTVLQSGSVKYDNTGLTPMTYTRVTLFDESGTQFTSVVTNATTGDFNFGQVPVGNYYVQFQTSKPWGGVNISDASRISQHAAGRPLTGIRQLAADVDGDGDIDNDDYSSVNNRVNNSILSFPAGNWVFGSGSGANFRGWRMVSSQAVSPSLGVVSSMGIPLTASANNTNLQYLALCLGDVNGSYTPQ
jgi:hypothetical protein